MGECWVCLCGDGVQVVFFEWGGIGMMSRRRLEMHNSGPGTAGIRRVTCMTAILSRQHDGHSRPSVLVNLEGRCKS